MRFINNKKDNLILFDIHIFFKSKSILPCQTNRLYHGPNVLKQFLNINFFVPVFFRSTSMASSTKSFDLLISSFVAINLSFVIICKYNYRSHLNKKRSRQTPFSFIITSMAPTPNFIIDAILLLVFS